MVVVIPSTFNHHNSKLPYVSIIPVTKSTFVSDMTPTNVNTRPGERQDLISMT